MDNPRPVTGFTLMEMVIAIAIIAVLSLVAIPSYLNYMQQGRRADAISSLLQLQLLQAEWHLNHGEYGSLAQLGWKPGEGNSLDGDYTITLTDQNAESYQAIAKPIKNQLGDTCGVFAVNQVSTVYSGYAGPHCWGR